MKSVLVLLALSLGLQAHAAPRKNICEKLADQAEANCEKAMCDQYLEDSEPGAECVPDGDFREGVVECAYGGELDALVKEYNKKHPAHKIGCGSDGSIIDPPAEDRH
jgi:hypothetical protein